MTFYHVTVLSTTETVYELEANSALEAENQYLRGTVVDLMEVDFEIDSVEEVD